jgi:hypothetical protein
MEMFDDPSWRWGLSLIALTMAFHAAAETELVKSKQRSSTQLGGNRLAKRRRGLSAARRATTLLACEPLCAPTQRDPMHSTM